MSLYPDHKPRGVRKGWEHTAMEESGATRILRRYGVPSEWGEATEAVGWFANDGDGELRILVADYPDRRRATLRRNMREYRLSFERLAA